MRERPTGTVTFLFTDIEGSTRLLEELGAERYAVVLTQHRHMLRDAFAAHDGVEVDTQGDAFCYAFGRASDALAAAADAQARFEGSAAIRVRMGVHTGEPIPTDEGYVGIDLHRAARITAVAHGGQVLVSQSTRDLIRDAQLRDLGEHRLKGLVRAERIWQLGNSDFAPLKSLNRTNLPLAPWPLLGREWELAEIGRLVDGGARIITLTGAGGSGKTRLALQAAADLADRFPDGVWFVPLGQLADAVLVRGAIAVAFGLAPDDNLDEALSSLRALAVLDNAEHLEGIEQIIAGLLVGELVVLVTSRSPLRVSAERELPVEPLPVEVAARLFAARAAALGRRCEPDETVHALCRRVDNLPLAIELAAARTRLLSPATILERLDNALAILTSGTRDAPERQRTLRATIAWSHDLLDPHAARVFRRLAVFRGGFTLGAAEAVASADLDVLEALVEQSLVTTGDDGGFLMLETIREFAFEQLRGAAEETETALRHAEFYRRHLEKSLVFLVRPQAPELFAWYEREEQNTWAALDSLRDAGETATAFTLADLLAPCWVGRGRIRLGAQWLEAALATDRSRSSARGLALAALARLLDLLRDSARAEPFVREAIEIGLEKGDNLVLAQAFRARAWIAYGKGDSQLAAALLRTAREHALATGDELLSTTVIADLAGMLVNSEESVAEAEAFIGANLGLLEGSGNERATARLLLYLSTAANLRGDYREAVRLGRQAFAYGCRSGEVVFGLITTYHLGLCNLLAGDVDASRRLFRDALAIAIEAEPERFRFYALEGIALSHMGVNAATAARILGAAAAGRDALGLPLDSFDERVYEPLVAQLRAATGPAYEDELAAGRLIALEEAVQLAFDLTARGHTA